MRRLLAPIHHAPTAACIEAERELQRRLEGGCQVPLGCYAEAAGDVLTLNAALGTLDGKRVLRASHSGGLHEAREIAATVEKSLVSAGAREILAALRPGR
jgi:hydroxymethylbilane synthase